MIFKLAKDQIIKQSETCGELREILSGNGYSPNIAIINDIKPTKAHYHNKSDEIYFVLDGYIIVRLFNPVKKETKEQLLKENELCVITKGIHHRIIEASIHNRMCVISNPWYDPFDEHLSNI